MPVISLPDVQVTLESSSSGVKFRGSWTDRFVVANAADEMASDVKLRLSREAIPGLPDVIASVIIVTTVNAEGLTTLESCLLVAAGDDCGLGDMQPRESRIIEVTATFINLPPNEADYPSVLGFRLEAASLDDGNPNNNVAVSDHVTQIPDFEVTSSGMTPLVIITGDKVTFNYEVTQLRAVAGDAAVEFFPTNLGTVTVMVDGEAPEFVDANFEGAAGAVRIPAPGFGGNVVIEVEGDATAPPEVALGVELFGGNAGDSSGGTGNRLATGVGTAISWDFGDDPFPPNTLWFWLFNGARHVLVAGGPTLGAQVDADVNGQPKTNSDGDDKDPQGDDEDGVVLDKILVAGSESSVEVMASKACLIDFWIDYNRDAVFDHRPAAPATISNEYVNDSIVGHVGGSFALKAGLNEIRFRLPSNLEFGTATARFRVSSAGGLTPTGNAADGEVEDHQVFIFDFFPDFGDAPDALDVPGYPTLLQNDGALHLLTEGGFFLGERLDFETDGKPSDDALGDDEHNGLEIIQSEEPDDEDGVIFLTPLMPGSNASLEVFLTSDETIGAKLDAWIDFNSDLDWNDLGEQVLLSEDLVPGTNTLTISIPADAQPGTTFARFRLSRLGNLTPNGRALSGEVEDYAVEIHAVRPPLVFSTRPAVIGGRLELELEFTPGDILEFAPSVNGPWDAVTGAVSPHRAALLNDSGFYRIRRP